MKSKNVFGLFILLLLLIIKPICAQEELIPPQPPAPTLFEDFSDEGEENENRYLESLDSPSRVYLETIKRYNKERYWDLLRDAYWSSKPRTLFRERDAKLYERNKKIAELEIGAESLGLKYQKDKNADKNQIKNELREKLNNLFELREEQRKFEVAELRERLQELEKSIDARIKNKDEIVKRRMQELLGEDKYLDWD